MRSYALGVWGGPLQAKVGAQRARPPFGRLPRQNPREGS